MASYELEITRTAEKQLKRLPREDQRRVVGAFVALAGDPLPHGARKLHGYEDVFRLRVGRYRILYSVADDRLVIQGHRPGKAEVEDLDDPLSRKEKVRRLDVAASDPLGMSGGKAIGHRQADVEHRAPGGGPGAAASSARPGSPLRVARRPRCTHRRQSAGILSRGEVPEGEVDRQDGYR